MGSPQMPHPDEEQLLRYADGELPAREAARVRSHLEACWQCRTELEELQKVIGECVRYRKNFLAEHLSTPPAPWGDIYRHFADIDSSLDRVPLSHRVARLFATRWIPAVVALAAICGIWYQWRHTPSVQAAELLRKAVAAADVRVEKPRRIKIRTRTGRVTRVVGTKSSSDLSAVQELFRKANYDWDDPLSAKSYRNWHDQLAGKRDEVTTLADCYQIRTSTEAGELAEATLKIRIPDLRPFEERFQFRSQEWVEITESADEPAAPPQTIAADNAARGAPASVPNPDQMRKPAPAATAGDELQVLVALHNLGADLGDPVEVTRSGGQIMVAGVGIDPRRKQQIQNALASMPHVVVRFSDPAPATVAPEAQASAGSLGPDTGLKARLEKQVGGRPNFEQFAAQLLDMSEIMMSRAYALRRLAERFSQGASAQLTAGDRQLLGKLYREHATILGRQVSEMERLLNPVLRPLGGSLESAARVALSSASWQPATEELLRGARHVETLLAVMLGAAPGEAASGDLPSQLLSSLAQLRASSQQCERLIASATGGD